MSPVGCLVFKTSETPIKRLVGSTPTSSDLPFVSYIQLFGFFIRRQLTIYRT